MSTTSNPDLPPSVEFRSRMDSAQEALSRHGFAGLVVSPGPDLRYLCGYDAIALERLTALVLRPQGAVLVVPRLELPAAEASPVLGLEVDLMAWDETADPFRAVSDLFGERATVGVEARMWAAKSFALAATGLHVVNGDELLGSLRLRKSAFEVAGLRAAGIAIDRVHEQVPGLLRPGRTEREVAFDISQLIMEAGHVGVDFVIVASGPNSASPHHAVSDRALQAADLVVVDIGGTMPSGYCSDCTRTYAMGEPDPAAQAAYDVLQLAQDLAVQHVTTGVTTAQIDVAARTVIAAAGYGDLFIHRTGHGIGLETHERPYLVAGDDTRLLPGMVFSVEPGIYLPGMFGARIEDIVACTESGWERLNHRSRDLLAVPI
jgi:Xaa-Pro aminopeptidase